MDFLADNHIWDELFSTNGSSGTERFAARKLPSDEELETILNSSKPIEYKFNEFADILIKTKKFSWTS